MRIWSKFSKAPLRVVKISQKRHQLRLRRQMLVIKQALSQEKTETIEMLVVYRKYTQRQASKAEMQQANAQFVDLIKGLGLGVFVVLPFAPVTIPIVLKLGKYVGVDILPSSFYQHKKLESKTVKMPPKPGAKSF
jgi:hypothetical protein